MDYPQKTIRLRDGRTAVFRAPRPEDAAEMLDYLRRTTAQTPYLASYPEEIAFTMEGEADYLRGCLTAPERLMIVCTVDGRIAGNCQLMRMGSKKTHHRAAVAIGLLQEFWGLGIGTAMFSEMIAAARDMGVRQLELEYIEGNERAAALYRKMGFTVMGVHPDAFLLRDGTSHAAVFMRLPLTDMPERTPQERVVRALAARGAHIAFAESCTGGLAAATLVGVPNASAVLSSSFVTYSPQSKTALVGVPQQLIERCGVVSEPVAAQMAAGAAAAAAAEVGVGITGLAGPGGGTADTPVGTVCFGFSLFGTVTAQTVHFPACGRNAVRQLAAEHVFRQLCTLLCAE